MDQPTEFATLCEQARNGDQDAARLLVERYTSPVLVVVRRRLNENGLRHLFDSTDFTQETWADFFRQAINKKAFDDPDKLISYLMGIAHNKVRTAERCHLDTDKRDQRREVSLSTPAGAPALALVDPAPAPEHAVIAEDAFAKLLREVPEKTRLILIMIRAGASHDDIADKLGVNLRTIGRILARLRKGTS